MCYSFPLFFRDEVEWVISEEVIEAQAHQQEDRDRKRGSKTSAFSPRQLESKSRGPLFLLTAFVTLTCQRGTPGHRAQSEAFPGSPQASNVNSCPAGVYRREKSGNCVNYRKWVLGRTSPTFALFDNFLKFSPYQKCLERGFFLSISTVGN